MRKRQLAVLSLMIGLLLAPMVAGADNHEMAAKPLTWINYVMSQPGKATPLTQNIAKGGAEIYDGMMADGHVLSWGVGMPVNHRPGDDWNVMEWVTFRDWAAVDMFMQKFMGMQMSKDPEAMKTEQQEWMSLVEAGSHYDEIVRHEVFAVSESGTPPAYLNLGYQTAKPGKGGALTKQFDEFAKPVLQKLLEEGAISSYGLAVPEVHGGGGGTHVFWYGMSNLAARDAVDAGFEAAGKERGEEEQKKVMAKLAEAFDFSAHHDRIIMVVHNGGGAGDDGGE